MKLNKTVTLTLIILIYVLASGRSTYANQLAPTWATASWQSSNKAFQSIEASLERKFIRRKVELKDVADAYRTSTADPLNDKKVFTAAYIQYWYMSSRIGWSSRYLGSILDEMNKMNPGASEYARIGYLIATGSPPVDVWVPKLGYRLLEIAPSDDNVVLALIIAIQSCPSFPIDKSKLRHYANNVALTHPGASVTYLLLGELYYVFYFDDLEPTEGHSAIFYYKKYISSIGITKEQILFAKRRIALTEEFLKNPPKPDQIIDLSKKHSAN